MPDILMAILPVFMLLALGWWFRRRRFPGEALWDLLDPLVYYVLLPSLLLHTFATVDLGQLEVLPAGLAVISAMLLASLLLLALRPRLGLDGPGFAALLQATVRFNTYVGFAVASQLYGSAGLTLFSVVVAFVTPTANVISVYGFTRFGSSARPRLRQQLATLASNPLILSVLGGVALNVSGVGLPWVLEPFFEVLGRAALPLGLLAAGAGLELTALRRTGGHVALGCALRLGLMPLLTIATTWVFGVEGLTRICVILYALMPVPPGAYILARQLGGDARYTAALIAATTLVALVTAPAWLLLLR